MVDLDLHDVRDWQIRQNAKSIRTTQHSLAKAMFDSNKSPNFMFTKSQKKNHLWKQKA
jgi:hypothetical protein